MLYQATLKGEFTITSQVEADSIEEATKKFQENQGVHIEDVAEGVHSVSDVSEVN